MADAYGAASKKAAEDLLNYTGVSGLVDSTKAALSDTFSPGFVSRAGKRIADNFTGGWSNAGDRVAKGAADLVSNASKGYRYATDEDFEKNMKAAKAEGDSDQTFYPDRGSGDLATTKNEALQYGKLQQSIPVALMAATAGASEPQMQSIIDYKNAGMSKAGMLQYINDLPVNEATKNAYTQAIGQAYQGTEQQNFVPKDPQIEEVENRVKNVAEGKGDARGVVSIKPEDVAPKDEGDLRKEAISMASTNLVKQYNVPENWYDSNSFNVGLIRFGLGLLSGEDYATAFSAAAGDFDNLYQREKRQSMYDELLSDGYSEASIMQWVQNGKADTLTKPKPVENWVQGVDSSGLKYQENTVTKQRTYLPQDMQLGMDALKEKEAADLARIKAATAASNASVAKAGSGSGSGKETESQARAASFSARAEYGVREFHDLWQKATDEMKNSSMTPDWMYKALSDRLGLGAEGITDAAALRYVEEQYPALADYRKNAMTALMPLIRDDSGAAIGKAEEQKEFMAYIPAPGASPEQYKRQMSALMERVIYTGAKSGKQEYKVAQDLVSKGMLTPVPTSQGIVFVDPRNPNNIYKARELPALVGGN